MCISLRINNGLRAPLIYEIRHVESAVDLLITINILSLHFTDPPIGVGGQCWCHNAKRIHDAEHAGPLFYKNAAPFVQSETSL